MRLIRNSDIYDDRPSLLAWVRIRMYGTRGTGLLSAPCQMPSKHGSFLWRVYRLVAKHAHHWQHTYSPTPFRSVKRIDGYYHMEPMVFPEDVDEMVKHYADDKYARQEPLREERARIDAMWAKVGQ